MCAVWCMECWLRMYQNGNQLLLRTCVLLCCFRDFFHTSAFKSPGSHRQIRWRCTNEEEFLMARYVVALPCACSLSPALLLCRNGSFLLLSPYSCPTAQGAASPPGILAPFPSCRPLERPFLPSRRALSRGFSSLSGREPSR